ncbi:restriction endonuclease subunit S [Phascolarctobacterium sp. ET69]|uniref:restriction endonuclease subunit S n=1 Tax=Phascolarctobacterium sp. ET69 TaxID=2939420 RepID=UPI00201120D3|nr:restriction endonuclease subunit S [Phascolarctobacterium sp. ET69]MCL1604996.1 restriction endonuclease subunit S [Phascolarctobacterium sp. ET69]
MTPQELKNSILQLAIQGKLVPQRVEEGNAENLYKQIQAEKQKLIKEGKIKKEKPLPPITDDEKPFEIPKNWKWVRLGEISFINGGYAFKSENFKQNGIRVIRISDFNENGLINTKIVRHIFDESLEPFLLKEKDIILCMTGGTVGKSYFVKKLNEQMMTNQRVATIRSIFVHQEYINFIVLSPLIQKIIKDSKNSTNDNISMGTINSFIVPLPPLAEQKRIVAKIEELLPYVERYETAYNKLQQLNKRFPDDLQKSVLQLAIQGKLVPQRPEEGNAEDLYKQIQAEKQKLIKEGKIKKEKPLPPITDDEKPFEIPENWKWVRLGEVIIFIGGYAYKSNSYVSKSNNQILRLGNIKQDTLLLDAKPVYISDELSIQTKNFKIQINDILITMTGTRRKKDYLYTTKINKNDVKARNLFLNQRVGCFRIVYGLVPEFLLKVLQSEIIRDLIFKKETGTANQGNIGSEDMKEFIYIPLPPFAEQKRIIAKIKEFLSLCDKLK